MNLFSVKKVGVFCDGIRHHNETRKSGDVKVITLTLRVDPFEAKLAVAMADVVRTTLFRLNHPDPHPHIRRCDFVLSLERQLLQVFASSDTPKATIALDQVKISRIYARTSKDANGYVLVFDATFGPVGREELEYAEAWRGTQRAVTFEAAEDSLDFDDADDQEDDQEDEDAPARPMPMFDTDHGGQPVEARPAAADGEEPANRPLHSHASRRNKTH